VNILPAFHLATIQDSSGLVYRVKQLKDTDDVETISIANCSGQGP